jgi:hypothetical protein
LQYGQVTSTSIVAILFQFIFLFAIIAFLD